MFLAHFNLTDHPFMETPPLKWILHDPRMEEALARLQFFREQGRLALVLGQTGVGKSTLLRLFIDALPQNRYQPLYLHLTPMNANAFLRLIVTSLGEAPKMGRDRLFLQIIERIRQNEKCTLLVVDEAHMLEPKALTDLRLLISAADNEPNLKIVLAGQESLRQTLKRASHADLVHRISVRFWFKSLTRDQTSAYIYHRLKMAGGSEKIVQKEAAHLIHEFTSGVPRQINNAATSCLINAASQKLEFVTEDLVNQTMGELALP